MSKLVLAKAGHLVYLWIGAGESPQFGVLEAVCASVYPGDVSLVFLGLMLAVRGWPLPRSKPRCGRGRGHVRGSFSFCCCQGLRCGTPSMYSGVRSAGRPAGSILSLLYSLHGGARQMSPTSPLQASLRSREKKVSSRMSCWGSIMMSTGVKWSLPACCAAVVIGWFVPEKMSSSARCWVWAWGLWHEAWLCRHGLAAGLFGAG